MKYNNAFQIVTLGDGEVITEEIYDATGRRLPGKEVAPALHSFTVDNRFGTEDALLTFTSTINPTIGGSVLVPVGATANYESQHDGEISQNVSLTIANGGVVTVYKTYVQNTIKQRNV